MQDIMAGLLCFAIVYFGLLGMVGAFGMSAERAQAMWWVTVLCVCVCIYLRM